MKNRSRVVNVSSIVAQLKTMNFNELTKSTGTINQYVISKLYQIVFTAEFARKFAGSGVTCYSVHPGVANTEAYRNLPKWMERMLLLFIKIFLKVVTQLYYDTNSHVFHNQLHKNLSLVFSNHKLVYDDTH